MEKRLHELEQRVDELSKTVEHLRARLDANPSPAPEAASAREAVAPSGLTTDEPIPLPEALAGIDPASARSVVPLIGRSLMVIAGAFVFRLITEKELVSRPVGVTLGLAFAALWVALAFRAGGKGERLSAGFHAAPGALIGYALLLEMGSKGLVPQPVVALVLAAFTGLLLGTAWRHGLQEVAWVAELGCLAAGAGLLRATDTPLPVFVVLGGLAVASVVLADVRSWPHLRWPVALFLDFVSLRLVFSLSARPEAEQGQLGAVVLVTQGIIGVYVLGLFIGTWFRARPVRAFEVLQTAVILTVGLAAITRVHGAAGPWGLLVAAGALTTALRLAPQAGKLFDACFYGVLGVALTFASAPLILSGPALGLAWGLVGLALALVGRWRLRHLMWGGAAVLLWAAAVAAGTMELLLSGLARSPSAEWMELTPAAAAIVGLALIGWALMTVRDKARDDLPARIVALGLLALTGLGLIALTSLGARSLLGGAAASAALVILLRTLLMCGVAVGLAFARKLGATLELSWAAWGLLVVAGLKVLAQDLPNGHAGMLVIAFLALGLAITAVPRLLRPAN